MSVMSSVFVYFSDLATMVKAIAKSLKSRGLEVLLVIPSKKAG